MGCYCWCSAGLTVQSFLVSCQENWRNWPLQRYSLQLAWYFQPNKYVTELPYQVSLLCESYKTPLEFFFLLVRLFHWNNWSMTGSSRQSELSPASPQPMPVFSLHGTLWSRTNITRTQCATMQQHISTNKMVLGEYVTEHFIPARSVDEARYFEQWQVIRAVPFYTYEIANFQ